MQTPDVTRAIQRLAAGHKSAADELMPLVYDELRRVASRLMQFQPANHTLEPTALVNEVCVRLLGAGEISWQNRAHFFAVAATAMRQILTSHARAKRTAKRGSGEVGHLAIDPPAATNSTPLDPIALDEVLTQLATHSPLQSRLVELRFYAGMTIEETALVLEISTATAEREWRMARAWLSAALHDESPA